MEQDFLNDFENIVTRLRERIKSPLPGWDAQLKLASMRRLSQGKMKIPEEGARLGCILILLYPVDNQAHVAFIQRNEYDGIHSGQISFPGGQQEKSDRSHSDTALREAQEETGIDPKKVTILGELTQLYIPPSNFLVFPVLGFSTERPDFKPDPGEVQHVIEVSITKLKDKRNIREKEIILPEGYTLTAPYYDIDESVIWGATAMILSELLEMV